MCFDFYNQHNRSGGGFGHVTPFHLVFILLSIACGVLIIVAGVEYITSETFKGVILGLFNNVKTLLIVFE
jgi:hypothetical protein